MFPVIPPKSSRRRARITHVGERASSEFSSASGGTATAINWTPHTLVDLYAGYRFNDNARLDLNIDNLTDQYYMDALTLGLMPSPGRTFRAVFTTKF